MVVRTRVPVFVNYFFNAKGLEDFRKADPLVVPLNGTIRDGGFLKGPTVRLSTPYFLVTALF